MCDYLTSNISTEKVPFVFGAHIKDICAFCYIG